MKLFEDEYKSMGEPIELPRHAHEDMRGCAETDMDEWVDDGTNLFATMFTVPEILSLFQ